MLKGLLFLEWKKYSANTNSYLVVFLFPAVLYLRISFLVKTVLNGYLVQYEFQVHRKYQVSLLSVPFGNPVRIYI